MKNMRILLTASMLMAVTVASWAQTETLHAGYNFLTCQVTPGGNISDPTFLSIPAGFPSDPNDPPTPAHHATYYEWMSSGFHTYYYFNAADANAWNGSPVAGWFDASTGDPAPVNWSPGEGAIIYLPYLPSNPNITLLGTPATTASRLASYPPADFDLRGSPSQTPINGTYVVPADIVSGPPVNGDAIYVYSDPPGTGNPFALPVNYSLYYYDSFQGGWVPAMPHITPNYRAVWVTHLTAISSAVIEGNVYQGSICGSTTPLQNWTVRVTGTPGTFYGISGANGHYAVLVPPGSYTVNSYQPPVGWNQVCGGPYNATLAAGGFSAPLNFTEKHPTSGGALTVDLASFYPYPLRTPCCGQNMTYVITYRNSKAVPVAGVQLRLFLPPMAPAGLKFVSDNGVPLSIPLVPTGTPLNTVALRTRIWNIGTLAANSSGNIMFTVTLPASTPSCPASISAIARIYDPTLSGSSTLPPQPITCSYDPNDMQVDPAGCGPEGYIPPAQPLTYLVKFQNVGTGPAYQVVVSNLLSASLDVSTFQVLGSSHPNVLQVQGNQLIWTFPNIYLPAQTDDDLGSQGYVKYQVSPLAAAPVGAVITNNASIYFDLNPPIITVTTTNTITANPVPVAAFSVAPAVGSGGQTNDFTYTGGSTGATYLWDFGPDATPSNSTDQNPAGVVFATDGDQLVTLQVSLGDCPSDPAMQIITVGVPTLNAQVVDDQLVLSWRGNGYHLQERGDLQAGTLWTATTSATVTQLDSDFTATIPLPISTIFYRLSQLAP